MKFTTTSIVYVNAGVINKLWKIDGLYFSIGFKHTELA